MAATLDVLLLTITLLSHIPSSSSSPGSHGLTRHSSLSVENKDHVLVSSDGLFTAGFHQVGENAYGFAVWFSEQTTSATRTIVWMANRDAPVNGKHSRLSLQEDGNLVLMDAGRYVIWSTNTKSTSSLIKLQLHSTGNLVLDDGRGQSTLWQSFDHPTDTLLPNQLFTKSTQLVSSRSSTNYSSGFYKMFFDNDSILRLLYDGPETTTIFWPDPGLRTWEAGRFQYQYSRRAILDSDGEFKSSDGWKFKSADFGMGPRRIMRIDIDGNVRVYSLVKDERRMKLKVQWQAISQPCKIHGTCGPNSLCIYSQDSDRKCSCLHGYKMVNSEDWSYGCEPEFKPCIRDECDFIELRHVEFYGYDVQLHANYTLDACKKECLQDDACIGFQFGWKEDWGSFYCCIKNSLRKGYEMGYEYSMYIKLPKRLVTSFHQKTVRPSNLNCPPPMLTTILRSYEENNDIKPLGFMLVFGCMIGFIEIVCIVVFWYCSSKQPSTIEQSYFPVATGFRKFTYSELKKASRNFSKEIGRGGACIVYKGKLSDNRIAAIKKLKNTNHDQGEAEFQAEINTIGRVNHMNLIETWGYCAEGKHRLVVYEYMENGSLAENLSTGKLDWATRLDIAVGTAKGLAYLHEECLEWVLHCDVKPHNILLDAHYNPKVADFGLSKLFDRGGFSGSNFSMIRGTRGYMAPEWVLNLPVTSKVDVYSYGVVILEMITGRNPVGKCHTNNGDDDEIEVGVIDWVRDKIQEKFNRMESWVEAIVDPSISGKYDTTTMENLVRIALQCVEEDSKARPSMSQVVNMLLHGCDDRIQKIQTIKMMEGIFVCAAPHCLKSFLKKTDFESHVHAIHSDLVNSNTQKDGNESEAASAKKPTTSDSTVQAPTPRPVQDGEDRGQRSQPPVRPLMQPKPSPQSMDNRPHGFDGQTPMHLQQQNFETAGGQQQGIMSQSPYPEYSMTTLQPPNFAVPVNPNVMGPASFGQPLYVSPQGPEGGMEQGSLMGYPQPWNVGPNGAPFDPTSMMMNQGNLDHGRVGFFQGANGKDSRDGRGILAATPSLPPPPPPLPPPFTQIPGGFFSGDTSHHGQGYGWQQDKRDGFGNSQD